MKIGKSFLLLPLFLSLGLALLFILLFYADNKYKTPPPYGYDGIIEITEADLNQNRPLFLIDGWHLTDARAVNLPTYIGEYSNLQRGSLSVSPHGTASYQLTLRYSGSPIETVLTFPQLFDRHSIVLDGSVLSQGNGAARISFTLTPGDHILNVSTVSAHGYYSGMYHPPALGKTEVIFQAVFIQCILYGLAFFLPLSLAVFTLVLWGTAGDKTAFWFGLLCCCYSLYISYYFVRLLSLSIETYWYLVQSAAFYGLCFCVIRLTALLGNYLDKTSILRIQRITIYISLLLIVLSLLIPILPQAVWLHGILTDIFYLFVFLSIVLMTLKSRRLSGLEQRFTQLACVCFGIGLVCNLFSSNLFEPILFYWQFEWCGLLLVALFAATMAARNKRILAENEAFRTRLEDLVSERTAQLSNLIQERKIFFSDMAHDLKAPIFAAGSFIQAIRENNTGIDHELLHYIDLLEQKRQEAARRVQGLTEFNRMDDVSAPYTAVSVQTLLDETYKAHHMAAEVASVHLITELPEKDGRLYAQTGKLDILLENLIFNALRATPRGGSITVSAELDEDGCHLSVADTGSGILPEDIPHIFERFYIAKQNQGVGSGLGLYIVKCITDAMGGEISVSSKPGQGAVFFIDLPLMKE